MLKSMTGFGKVINSYPNFDVMVEIKSVNSKYFDPSFRLPKVVSHLEILLRAPLQEILIRGKVEVRIEITMKSAVKIPILNEKLIAQYEQILNQIKDLTKTTSDIRLEHYLRMPDIIEFKTNEDMEEELELKVTDSAIECAKKLNEMRKKEGENLTTDIKNRIDTLKENIEKIENARTDIYSYWADRFKKRLAELGVNDINEERISQEAAIYSEKADITEELTRLKCHLTQFENIIKNEENVGKKLDFLSQELHRELNTIASKSTRSEIIKTVVESKAEADRIREQIQNII